jgi:uncharacterized membrane protein YkvA (DUF1232 family)
MRSRGTNSGRGSGFGETIGRGAFFGRLKDKAKDYLNDPKKLKELIERARTKAKSAGRDGPLKPIMESVMALLRLLRAYWRGDYRQVPLPSLILIVAGVLYLVSPIDIIPDFLVGVGFVDDAAVLAWVIGQITTVLDEFLNWEASRPPAAMAPVAQDR